MNVSQLGHCTCFPLGTHLHQNDHHLDPVLLCHGDFVGTDCGTSAACRGGRCDLGHCCDRDRDCGCGRCLGVGPTSAREEDRGLQNRSSAGRRCCCGKSRGTRAGLGRGQSGGRRGGSARSARGTGVGPGLVCCRGCLVGRDCREVSSSRGAIGCVGWTRRPSVSTACRPRVSAKICLGVSTISPSSELTVGVAILHPTLAPAGISGSQVKHSKEKQTAALNVQQASVSVVFRGWYKRE